MNDRERFLATMRYQSVDRAPFWDMGTWPETDERWDKERPAATLTPVPTDKRQWITDWFFPNPPFEHRVLEEDDRTVTYVNHEGIILRERKDCPDSSMPQFLKFPVETREEFRTFWKARMNSDLSKRIGDDWIAQLAEFKRRDYPLIVIADRWGGFFGPLRNMLGVENLCTTFYDDPAFIEEMMDANADFIIEVMDRVLDHTDVDTFGFWEDMAYNTAPLISPAMVKKFMQPRYRRVCDFLYSRGVEFISLDSDGNMYSLIPIWMDAGINVLYPFEVQSGMDVNQVRREFGRDLRLWFGVDKRTAAWGKAEIDAEMRRIAPLVRDGGYIPGPDHAFPPDVSYDNYAYFTKKLYEVL